MDDNKQQIIHYFIEEAQEHLETVEQGLLDLTEVIADAERVNEMFRAAHSIKGGAAMLGFDSIKSVAHKLEDCFKILRDHPVPIDRKLETLFLAGCDALKTLVEELANSPTTSLNEAVVDRVLSGSAANFVTLQEYLEELLNTNTQERNSESSELVGASRGGNAVMAPPINVVVQEIDLPIAPIKPKLKSKKMAAVLGLLIGGFLGVLFIVLRKKIKEALKADS